MAPPAAPIPARIDVVDVLVIEDNPGDATLIEEGFLAFPRCRVTVVPDGRAGLAVLRGPGFGAPRPALVVLDLNLPGMDGREVLAEIREDATLRRLPVVILTTSSEDSDIAGCYALTANSYVTKPIGLKRFRAAVSELAGFWIETAQLPHSDPPTDTSGFVSPPSH